MDSGGHLVQPVVDLCQCFVEDEAMWFSLKFGSSLAPVVLSLLPQLHQNTVRREMRERERGRERERERERKRERETQVQFPRER